MSYSSSGGGLNLIRRLFQTVSELKTYICSQYVEMEHTLAEKRRNLLCYTPKPHSHALNDVIMHKTHYAANRARTGGGGGGQKTLVRAGRFVYLNHRRKYDVTSGEKNRPTRLGEVQRWLLRGFRLDIVSSLFLINSVIVFDTGYMKKVAEILLRRFLQRSGKCLVSF